MDLRLADPELKLLQEAEVIELLNQPIYLRVAMINARDGTPQFTLYGTITKMESSLPLVTETAQRSDHLRRTLKSIFLSISLIEESAVGRVPKSSTTLTMPQRY